MAPRFRHPAWTWFTIAGILAITVGILHIEGRRWWCGCGNLTLWAGDPKSAHCSQHLVDPYFFTHVLHGVCLCGILALTLPRLSSQGSFITTISLEALWEVVENSQFVIQRYRTATLALGYEGDSIVNSVGDVAACALGWVLARRLGWRWSIVVCVATELLLLLWIRDNLLLNIVMLAYPIEAVKQWQMHP